MFKNCAKIYLRNQFVAGFSASLLVMVSAASFAWVSPILHLLNKDEYTNVLIPMTSTDISWMVSFIEIGSLFSPFLSGFISDCFGRKYGIAFAAPFIISGWMLVLLTRDAISLYMVRLLHGLGMGFIFTAVPIYLGEIAEAKVRGGLTALLQTMWYTGVLFQYIIGSYLSYNNSALINLLFCIATFLFFFFTQPESPYYLTMKKKYKKAIDSLMALRGKFTEKDVDTEMKNIRDCIEKDMVNKSKWSDVFKISYIEFKILMIVQSLIIFRVGSGTITISVYLSKIFEAEKWNVLSVQNIMAIYGCLTLLFIIIAMFCIDFIGRRPLLIFSCIGTGLCSLTIGCFFLIDLRYHSIDLTGVRWIPALALILFTIMFALGLGPVTQTIQSELFPTNFRALGNTITSIVITIISFLGLRFFQIIVDSLGLYFNFFVFSFISFFGAIFVYSYVPETKGKTFLEISEFFFNKDNTDTEKRLENTNL